MHLLFTIKKTMDLSKYTDFGVFDSKSDAISYRNVVYSLCSYCLVSENNKIRLWIKLPTN